MADTTNEAMSCFDMAQAIQQSPDTQAAADLAAFGVTAWGPGGGAMAMLDNAGRGELVHDLGPAVAGNAFYGACLPIEAAQEVGHSIGSQIHDYFAAPEATGHAEAPAPNAFGHPDAFGGGGGGHGDASSGGHSDAGGGHDSGTHGGGHDMGGGAGGHDGGMGGM